MALYWGLDSWTATNLSPTTDGKTFYDRIISTITPAELKARNEIRKPFFWGRYLAGRSPISAIERDYLLARNVGILLIHNGLTKDRVKKGEAEGRADAVNATTLANRIVITKRIKVWIYANIDVGFVPTAAWLAGWMKGMFASEYGGVGGLYCNTYDGLFNLRLGQALETVASDVSRTPAVIRDYCKLFIQNPMGGSGVEIAKKDLVIKFNPKQCEYHPSGSAIWQASIDRYAQSYNLGGVDICVANINGQTGIVWPS